MILYEPIKDREPFFTGWDTNEATYEKRCPHCRERISVVFKEMLDAAWGWRDRMDPSLRDLLAKVFGIDLTNRSIGSGMPGVVAKKCESCGASSYFYFSFLEISNSVYRISLRAAATDEPNETEQGGGGQADTRAEST